MEKYFALEFEGEPMKIFSLPHSIAIVLIFTVCLFIVLFRHKLREGNIRNYIRYMLAMVLMVDQASLYLWYVMTDIWSFAYVLPLNLCGAAVILSIILLLNESYSIYEIIYFWGFGGTLQAVITPDLGGYNFPHYRFFQFFVSHGVIIVTAVFMTFIYSYRPKLVSVFKVWGYTNLLLVVAVVVNIITDGNYLYVCRKPTTPSLMDYLGPWPWYILSLEAVAIVSFLVYYLPFAVKDLYERRKNESKESRTNLSI